jgi:hypothetical protein
VRREELARPSTRRHIGSDNGVLREAVHQGVQPLGLERGLGANARARIRSLWPITYTLWPAKPKPGGRSASRPAWRHDAG